MTMLLDQALEAARHLPPSDQDEIARIILQLAGSSPSPYPLTDEERAAISISKAAASRGDFASDQDVRAIWAKHGL
jgi:hypothetical protein